MRKVLFIHHSGLIGGAGVSLYNVVKTVSIHNEVYVALSTDPHDMIDLLQNLVEEYKIRIIPYGRRIGATTYYSGGDTCLSPRFIYRAILIQKQKNYWNQLINEIDPDVVVVNSKTTSWISRLSEVKKRNSVCFVRETVKGNSNNPINRYIARCLDGFSRVIFLSEFDRKNENLKSAQTEVIHNYVSEDQFDDSLTRKNASEILGLSDKSFHVVFVGGVSEIKGFDLAVQAVLLCPENVKLIVAGNDFELASNTKDKRALRYVEHWKKVVAERDLQSQIIFVGKQHDMTACYSCADVVLFPMREPHQARPAFEAGYFKKPIIITDFDNIREFVTNGYNGLTANSESVNEFKDCIMELMDDSELRERLGENNYLNTIKNHDQKMICQRINQIIEEYIES